MAQFCVSSRDSNISYWVMAASKENARRLVGLNATNVKGNIEDFDCDRDDKHSLPLDRILTSGGLEIIIVKR